MKIIIAGDFCDKLRVKTKIASGDYEAIFGNVKSIIEAVDYSIVNFEFPVVRGVGNPIKKCGPNLQGQLASVDAARYAGFNVATLANNHILDQGVKCAVETQKALNDAGIKTLGLRGGSLPHNTTLYLTVEGGESVAIINCCEHEFSVSSDREIGANPMNPVSIYYQIKEARTSADYVIVITHGGHEHFNLPSPRMKELYRYFIGVGADAVVNHHQHCYSGYEIYNGKPIFYGLGNFLFDHTSFRHNFWNEGYMVQLEMSSGNVRFELIPYTQCNEEPCVKLLDEDEKNHFYQNLEKMNSIISDDDKLEDQIKVYYDRCSQNELDILEPYNGKILSKMLELNMLPRWIKKDKLLAILNHTECESHRDKMLFALKSKIK